MPEEHIAILVCPHCAKINRLGLPPSPGKIPKCGHMSCRRRLPFVSEIVCPICAELNNLEQSRCIQCGASFGVPILRPFPSWPGRFAEEDYQQRENVLARLSALCPPVRVNDTIIDPHDAYGSLRGCFVLHLKLLEDWSAEVSRSNPDGHCTAYERHQFMRDSNVHSRKRRFLAQFSDLASVRTLDGLEFELLLGLIFLKMGYAVELTPASGDQGADLILRRRDSHTMAVQAKNTKAPVGNEAVQEVLGAMQFHACSKGLVVSTSAFTRSAQDLAEKCNIELWSGSKVEELCQTLLA